MIMGSKTPKKMKSRKLSIPRLLLVGVILLLIGCLNSYGTDQLFTSKKATAAQKQQGWFASYVDATVTPQYNFEQYEDNVVLSFVVAEKDGKAPTWGAAYSLAEAGNDLDLDRRIARLRQNGAEVIVSFGGLLNNELATQYSDADELAKAYQSVVERYELNTIDLDLENEGLTDRKAGKLRGAALAKLQKTQKKAKKELAIWLTLPVTPAGLTKDGTDAVAELLTAGVDLAGVNIMTMDYGGSRDEKLTMGENSINALKKTHRQLKILYQDQKINLSDEALWGKLGATPMIGQNDVIAEVFTLADAQALNEFAQEKNLGRLSMWSANRDRKSSQNNVNTQVVSNHNSGVKQDNQQFADTLKKGLTGSIAKEAKRKTVSDVTEKELNQADDPKTSPYEIWSEGNTYLGGTKVVWKHNVYRAKWWTKGDAPDSPVLQESEIPWELVGPVLPDEKPIPLKQLPKGTYPEWEEGHVYQKGDRVMFDEHAYEAKWWNKDENPEKSSPDAELVPWNPLSQEEIKKILAEKEAQK